MRSTTLALLAAAAMPAAANAAPIPGASYGGGAPPASMSKKQLQRSIHADAHVTTDGTRGRARVYAYARCTNGTFLSQRFDASGPIDAAGRMIAQARSLRYRGPGAENLRPRGIGIADIVFDGARAYGTVRVQARFRVRRSIVRCDSGPRAVEMRSVASDPGAPGGAAPGAAYFGTLESTFRGRLTPITFKVNRTGTKIGAALFGAGLGCPRRAESLANISPAMRIRNGAFRRVEKFTIRYSNAVDRVRVILGGRFTAAGATGTVNVRQVTTFRNGARAVCRTGTVRWNAVR
jgi:hypothetical protein